MTTTPALQATGISKTYGHFPALKSIDVSVSQGVSVTLFGRNGAGKTTFLKIAATLAKPSAGKLSIHGLDIKEEAEQARRYIGFLSHNTYVYRDLSPRENLAFFSKLYGLRHTKEEIDALIGRVGLSRRRNDTVRSFSRGLLQRVGLARVMLHNPRVLLLDEPYTGLDAGAVETLNELLDEAVSEGRTVILTTHDLELGLRAASEVHIIDRGRIVYSGNGASTEVRTAYARHVRSGTE
jgi:heme exporter protein A